MRRGMRVAFGLVLLLCILIGGGYAFMSQASFGKLPEGDRLDAISQSPHYEGGAFRNTEPLPPIKGNGGIVGALMKYVFSSTEGQKPTRPMPSAKTDLRGLDRNTDTVVWLGHSSYFVQLGGRRLLIDPVFSTYASPVFFANRAFEGTNLYTAEDMPDIDYLLISHDHWDHLDYATATALRSWGRSSAPSASGPILRLGATARKRFSRETGIPSLRGKAASPSTSCPPAISRAAH